MRNQEFIKSKGDRNSTRYYVPELNDWISCRSLNKYLDQVGLNTQSYYDKYFLDEDKLCPICKKSYKRFLNVKSGYNKTCGNPECSDRHRKNSIREAYKDPELRNKISKLTKEGFSKNPESLIIRNEKLKSYYSNDDNREKFRSYMVDFYKKNPEITKMRAERLRDRYENDIELYEKVAKNNKDRWNNPTDKMLNWLGYKSSNLKVFSKFDNKIIKLDSKWELGYFNKCLNDPLVKSIIRYHKISIEYFDTRINKLRYYIPDFLVEYIDEHKELVEIKPSRLLDDELVILKSNSAMKYCENNDLIYRIITENDMNFYKYLKTI